MSDDFAAEVHSSGSVRGQDVDWAYLLSVLPDLADGLRITLIATLAGMAIAGVVGLLMAIVQVIEVPVLASVTRMLLMIFRNTPLLAQLFFLFYVLPQFGILLDALTVGIIGLAVQYSCYTAESFRGGFTSVPPGQWEACRVLGLSQWTTLSSVIIPQALRPIVPALGNNLISMFKDSSVLSAITILELVGVARNLTSLSFQYTTLFTAVGLIYFAISYPSSLAVRALEIRLSSGRRRRVESR